METEPQIPSKEEIKLYMSDFIVRIVLTLLIPVFFWVIVRKETEYLKELSSAILSIPFMITVILIGMGMVITNFNKPIGALLVIISPLIHIILFATGVFPISDNLLDLTESHQKIIVWLAIPLIHLVLFSFSVLLPTVSDLKKVVTKKNQNHMGKKL